jgi:hypothetical protein
MLLSPLAGADAGNQQKGMLGRDLESDHFGADSPRAIGIKRVTRSRNLLSLWHLALVN